MAMDLRRPATRFVPPWSPAAPTGCMGNCLERVSFLRQLVPHVHSGFWDAYQQVRSQVMTRVRQAMEEAPAPLFVTGHSLGGALAVISAFDLESSLPLSASVTAYTFGAPCVGNWAFVQEVNRGLVNHFRVAVDADAITSSKTLGMYHHAGIQVLVDSHCLGNVIVAPTSVETLLRHQSAKDPRTSAKYHRLRTYRDCLEACFDDRQFTVYQQHRRTISNGSSSGLQAHSNDGTWSPHRPMTTFSF